MQNIVVILYHVSALSNWILRLLPYMKDVNIHIIHFSKLQKQKMPIVVDVNFYDVSYFSYRSMRSLIKNINPNKVLFFTFRSVLDFTMYKLCIELGIKKVYLEHGLFSADSIRFRLNLAKKNPWETAKRQLMHIYKYLGYALNSNKFFNELKEFGDFYRHGKIGLIQFDRYYLYSQRSVDCYSEIFDNIPNNYTIVGYPIFSDENEKANAISFKNTKNEGVVYVHQPLICDGIASISYEEEKLYLINMAKLLSPVYGTFTILLHPRDNLREYLKMFENEDVAIVQSPNDFKVFVDKKIVIGHYSTALLYGLYFKKITVIIDYPSVEPNEIFKEIFPHFSAPDELLKSEVLMSKKLSNYMLGNVNTYENIAICINS